MAKRRLIKEKPDETVIDNNKAITPKPKKVVASKSGKTGAMKTAPKKVKTDEVAASPATPKKATVKKEPANRTPKQEVSKVEITKNIPVAERIGPAKTKNVTDATYIRVSSDADIEKFKEMAGRIQNGTLQWAYFAVDGEKSYHYYLVIK